MYHEYEANWPEISYSANCFDVEDDNQLPTLKDLSLNYKEIGGHLNLNRSVLTEICLKSLCHVYLGCWSIRYQGHGKFSCMKVSEEIVIK